MKKSVKKDNPKAFKHLIGKELLSRMADALCEVHPAFDKKQFLTLSVPIHDLELKPRVQCIRDQLKKQLPQNFSAALKILILSLRSRKLNGFDLWPYTEFIQTYGLEHLEISLDALYKLTLLFTSEFAVRPFLKMHSERTLQFLNQCTTDENAHVRRWASEGSRPRLPWGERLDQFIQNPESTIPILEKLKYDDELYVRKSVANHLNDIAKDNPAIVIRLLKKWQQEADELQQKKISWIVTHSLRTLIKQGHPEAIALIGAKTKVNLKTSNFKINRRLFKVNDRIEFTLNLQSLSNKPQKIIVDYIIHYMKANKSTSAKVYKLKTFTLKPKETIALNKKHHLKLITTRRYYPGTHTLEIQINGRIYKKIEWTLIK